MFRDDCGFTADELDGGDDCGGTSSELDVSLDDEVVGPTTF